MITGLLTLEESVEGASLCVRHFSKQWTESSSLCSARSIDASRAANRQHDSMVFDIITTASNTVGEIYVTFMISFGQFSKAISKWSLKSYVYRLLYNIIDCLIDLVRQISKFQSKNPGSKILSRVIKSLALLLKIIEL
ncbi:hypothetical protein Tco_0708742 [Tanacetum coccineum]